MSFSMRCDYCGARATGGGQGMRETCPNGCDRRERDRREADRRAHVVTARCAECPVVDGRTILVMADDRNEPPPCPECGRTMEFSEVAR